MVLLLAHDRSSLNLAHPGTADGGCRKGMSAVERQPVARAVLRAAEATQQFILGFLALVHAVTELVRVQADPRVSASLTARPNRLTQKEDAGVCIYLSLIHI